LAQKRLEVSKLEKEGRVAQGKWWDAFGPLQLKLYLPGAPGKLRPIIVFCVTKTKLLSQNITPEIT